MLLELHFGLIGSQGRRFMKWIGRLLPLAMPILSCLFLLTDTRDVAEIVRDPIRGRAFMSHEYGYRVIVRLGTVLVLACIVVTLGIWSFREWLRTEEALVRLRLAAEKARAKTPVV
jgi:hypothetical protein